MTERQAQIDHRCGRHKTNKPHEANEIKTKEEKKYI